MVFLTAWKNISKQKSYIGKLFHPFFFITRFSRWSIHLILSCIRGSARSDILSFRQNMVREMSTTDHWVSQSLRYIVATKFQTLWVSRSHELCQWQGACDNFVRIPTCGSFRFKDPFTGKCIKNHMLSVTFFFKPTGKIRCWSKHAINSFLGYLMAIEHKNLG